jgi:hypothetical protein
VEFRSPLVEGAESIGVKQVPNSFDKAFSSGCVNDPVRNKIVKQAFVAKRLC